MSYVLSCYSAFHCIASRCRHTCCKGWEIDIDSDTAGLYAQLGGALGDRLREAIGTDHDGNCYFRLDEDERCPMLRPDGLCDLILELGEEALCDICAMHPRFCHDLPDRTEIGLGLCCEEAARLQLTWREKMYLTDGDENDVVSGKTDASAVPPAGRSFFAPGKAAEKHFSPFGAKRDQVIALLQDRDLPVLQRMKNVADMGSLTWPEDSVALASMISDLETMDPEWTRRLKAITAPVDRSADDPEWQTMLEQLAVVLVFRHLPPDLPDEEVKGRLALVLASHALIMDLTLNENGPDRNLLPEIARQFSSEIEYSDENPGLLIAKLISC